MQTAGIAPNALAGAKPKRLEVLILWDCFLPTEGINPKKY
jgi:hypothetical protein